jgi:hypothetical protein
VEDIERLNQLFVEFWNLKDQENYFIGEISHIIIVYLISDINFENKLVMSSENETIYNTTFI